MSQCLTLLPRCCQKDLAAFGIGFAKSMVGYAVTQQNFLLIVEYAGFGMHFWTWLGAIIPTKRIALLGEGARNPIILWCFRRNAGARAQPRPRPLSLSIPTL